MSSEVPAQILAACASPSLGAPVVKEIAFNGTAHQSSHVVVRNTAVGLNPTDYKHARGDWSSRRAVVLGSESVGIAVRVPTEVEHIKQGDRVAGLIYGAADETNGAAAQATLYDGAHVWPVPAGMSDEEAAGFSLAHFTAVQTLYLRWNLLKPSQRDPSVANHTILVWGASTAVGHHAVQLLSQSGYRVIAVASTARHEAILRLGAVACFDYKDGDVVDKIRRAAGDNGIRAAYDTAASNGSTDLCIDAIGPQGGKVMSTLPPSEDSIKRRSDVAVEFCLVYTLMGYKFTFANAFDFPAQPEDRARASQWILNELPMLLDGWKQGAGSPRYKPQQVRVVGKDLDGIELGIEILRSGSYQAEKLVCRIV